MSENEYKIQIREVFDKHVNIILFLKTHIF